jgi:predicted NAD-dependent protein-ADP-ribosyltransferase YbiA (DUF1768 family)
MAYCTIDLRNLTATSSESLYQAARFPHDLLLQQEIASLDGHSAKRAARSHVGHTTEDWGDRRRVAMFAVLNLKLQSPLVIDCLLGTRMAPIIEVSPTDVFWGAKPADDCFLGANLLGRMWMALRSMRHEQRANAHRWATRRSAALWPHLN